MIIRNHLKNSVCCLCIFAIVSFFMIFVISVTLVEDLHNKVKIFTPMTMRNITTWANIPGALNYTYSKSVYLFSIDSLDPDSALISLTAEGPMNYTVNRQFVKPVYDDAKKVVNYTMQHKYTWGEETSELHKKNITMLNLDGMSVWY